MSDTPIPIGPIRLADILAPKATTCERCGVLCRMPDRAPDEEARVIKYASAESDEPKLCASCVITGWLKASPLAEMITPEKLTWEPFQRQMGALLAASGHEDASGADIDWAAMVEHWDLPIPTRKRARRRKR